MYPPEHRRKRSPDRRSISSILTAKRMAIGLGVVGVLILAIGFIADGGGGGLWLSRADSSNGSAAGAGTAAEDDGVVSSIEELHEVFGEPPDAVYGRIRISSLGIDAPIGQRHVGADGVMPNPTGPDDVVWYDFSSWPGLGGYPGGGENAVFAAHVDRNAFLDYAGVQYIGPGAFSNLGLIQVGDTIEVEMEGGYVAYTVSWMQDVGAEGSDWDSYFAANTGEGESLTLITCGGDFNADLHAYSHRTVVRAVRTS